VLFVNVDLGDLMDLKDLDKGVQKIATDAARDLAAMTRAKLIELANEKLHSRRQMFIDGLHMKKSEDEGVYIVSLDAKVRWIDDGLPAHNMLDALLASPKAKRAADGHRYLVVPFQQGPGQGKTESTPEKQDLIGEIKKYMKSEGIPFGAIEKDAAGQAKTGKLHAFTLGDKPIKTRDGPGMGHGQKGDVRQGPTGIPFLQNVNVYQNKNAKGKVKRSILTFRIASDKQRGEEQWNHPGTGPINMFEDAAKWAQDTWEKDIAPGIINKILMETS
jgi:hypothetical protein